MNKKTEFSSCLLYTSDAADERSSVDLGGRRIIKKKNNEDLAQLRILTQHSRHRTTPTTSDLNKHMPI